MGRSFAKITPDHPADPAPAKPFYHAASDSYFTMIQRDGKTYQRRWQLDYKGNETNIEEKPRTTSSAPATTAVPTCT